MTDIGGYRLVVFDCDGTLVDSQHNIVAGMLAAWRRHGLPEPTPEQIRRQVGLTLEIGIARVLESDDHHRVRLHLVRMGAPAAVHSVHTRSLAAHQPIHPARDPPGVWRIR